MKYTTTFVFFFAIFISTITGRTSNYIATFIKSPPPPPPVDDAARMARYIVHNSDFGSLSHISRQQNITGLAMARFYSISDGPISMSTGVPYLYVSPIDAVIKDIKVDNRCSLTISMAATDFCAQRKLDPQDPRCPQVILTGYFDFLQNNTKEWQFAEKALFPRHPEMKTWPKSHDFTFAKLFIKNIILVDNIGGSKYPSVQDYFKATPSTYEDEVQYSIDLVL